MTRTPWSTIFFLRQGFHIENVFILLHILQAFDDGCSPVKIKLRVEKIRTKGFSADSIPLVPQ